MTLKCAADLDSNLFWRSLGLICTGSPRGWSPRRKRKINDVPGPLAASRSGSLVNPIDLAVAPAFQRREDCRDTETGSFLVEAPQGFYGSWRPWETRVEQQKDRGQPMNRPLKLRTSIDCAQHSVPTGKEGWVYPSADRLGRLVLAKRRVSADRPENNSASLKIVVDTPNTYR